MDIARSLYERVLVMDPPTRERREAQRANVSFHFDTDYRREAAHNLSKILCAAGEVDEARRVVRRFLSLGAGATVN